MNHSFNITHQTSARTSEYDSMVTLSNLFVNTQRAYGVWNDEVNAQHQALEVQNVCNLRALVSLNLLQNPNNP
jgi:hypothetical protein